MTSRRPFRFGVQGRSAGPLQTWKETVQRVELLGYDTYAVLDHYVRGFDPIAAVAAAGMITSRLRLGTLVLDNDFRHPVTLVKALGSLDVLLDGRLEIGIGAGWLRSEYEQAGVPFDPPGVRIDRLVESVAFMRHAFLNDPITFDGTFVRTQNLELPPKPIQQPSPPILIGGGGRRILRLAGEHADIVGFTSRARPDGSKDPAELTSEGYAQKVEWVKEGARDRFPTLELATFVGEVIETRDRTKAAQTLAGRLRLTAPQILDSPYYLIGTIEEMCEELVKRRERLGLSYVVVEESKIDQFAPVVAMLSGA